MSVPDRLFSPIVGLVVASVHDRSFPLVVGLVVVLVWDHPSSPIVGSDSSHVLVVLVSSFLTPVLVCALNSLPPVCLQCRDCFSSKNGRCLLYSNLTQS